MEHRRDLIHSTLWVSTGAYGSDVTGVAHLWIDSRYPPFYDENDANLFGQILKGKSNITVLGTLGGAKYSYPLLVQETSSLIPRIGTTSVNLLRTLFGT